MDLRIFNCRAQWITMQDDKTPAPLFRKQFSISKPISKTVCKISGLGTYILYIDGKRVNDSILEPRFSDYRKTVYYNESELPYLTNGSHTIGITLGRSRLTTLTENVWGWHNPPWDTKRRLVLQLDIYYENGTFDCVRSDETWKYEYGPVRFDCLYAGEKYDVNYEIPGWSENGCDESNWEDAIIADEPAGKLTLQESPPIIPIREIKPISVRKTGIGSTLYEFDENIAGNALVCAKGHPNSSMVIRYGEKINDDLTVNAEYGNVSGNLQEDSYIFANDKNIKYMPIFTYKGFRYIEIVTEGTVKIADVTGVIYHNKLDSCGTLNTSSDMINKIHEHSVRALLSNLHHTPTDTPIYEKNGWTGDAQLTSMVALYNFNVNNLYSTWMDDFADSMHANGELPPIIPSPGWGYTSSDFGWEAAKPALPAWDGAYFEIIKNLHMFYDRIDLIEKHFPSLKKYLEYLTSCSEECIVQTGLGDWLAPNEEDHSKPLLQPDENKLSSTAYYYRMVSIIKDFAHTLGKHDDENNYRILGQKIKQAFNDKYLDYSTGRYSSAPEFPYRQTPNILALAFGMVSNDIKYKTASLLAHDIEQTRKCHLWTGILGTTYILDVLSDYGYVDLAHILVEQDTYPSWGYWFKNGATSMYETWELDSRSRNHHMFGTIDSWFYKYLCGIRPTEPGFKSIEIIPYFPKALESSSASYKTKYGVLKIDWKKAGNNVIIDIFVPKDIKAIFKNSVIGFETTILTEGHNSIEFKY